MEPLHDVVGIGNALVDVVSQVDDAFLRTHGLTKGAMTLIDSDRAEELYHLTNRRTECSGGSAANTMAGLASLGGSSAYIGMVHADPLGEVFRRDIRAAGVSFESPAAQVGPSTGRCMVFVTPDAQRTMQTYLGASATLSPDDILPEAIQSARILYLEGYLFDPPPAKAAFLAAAGIAHAANRQVALSLSDSFCVDRHRQDFARLVAEHVDIVFANESEIVSLYQATSLNEALQRVRLDCNIAAVTLGAKGSVVISGDQTVEVAACAQGKVVDTTGAGDMYAAGFLFGLSHGRSLATSGQLGSIVACEIIGYAGARPGCCLAELIKDKLETN